MTIDGLKVALVLNDLRIGGSERQALLLARHLAAAGAAVTVIGLTNTGELVEECDRLGIGTIVGTLRFERSLFHSLRNGRRFLEALRRSSPDVIIGYTSVPNVFCGLLWRRTSARLFIWNQRDSGLHRMPRLLERRAAKNTRHFVANSGSGASFLAEAMAVPRHAVTIVPNGVDLSSPAGRRAHWRADLGIDAGEFVAAMIGNIRAPKDHITLIEAWKIVADRSRASGRRAVLLLVGRRQEGFDLLTERVRSLGLEGRVLCLGRQQDVRSILGECDLGVFSSRSEGLPNGVLDCMAAGLAVAATDLEGTRECLGAEQRDCLAPAGDVATLAERIVRLMEDGALRERLGEENRKRVAEKFSPRAMSERMVALIGEGLTEGRKNHAGGRT